MFQEFSAHRLDVKAFAEDGARLSGQTPVSAFERLMAETEGRGGERLLAWRARGEIRNPLHVHPHLWLHLSASATLSLTCQRCLSPVDIDVAFERSFRFVADERMAEAEDDSSEEDLLALSRSFDLMGLVEDEMLMDQPLVPRHAECPEPLPAPVDDLVDEEESSKPNPFAILGKLKK